MKKVISFLMIAILAISCAKWVSVDISDSSVILISPVDNQVDSIQEKNFVIQRIY